MISICSFLFLRLCSLFLFFFFTFAVFFHVVYVKHKKGVVRRREVNIDIPIKSRVDTLFCCCCLLQNCILLSFSFRPGFYCCSPNVMIYRASDTFFRERYQFLRVKLPNTGRGHSFYPLNHRLNENEREFVQYCSIHF